jgi:hypothetical protein
MICSSPSLLISEVVVTPAGGEFVEIHNPWSQTVSLSQIYIADWPTYYNFTQSGSPPFSSDFVLKFPAGATIAANGFVVVAIPSASTFNSLYMTMPDYDLDGTQGVPAMEGDYGGGATLTNGAEMLVLFQWNGVSDLVQDHDYIVWGDSIQGMDKSGITVGTGTYLSETPLANQMEALAPGDGASAQRCDTAESTETVSGGNGITGHDETSENLATAFKSITPPTPKAAPPAASCP